MKRSRGARPRSWAAAGLALACLGSRLDAAEPAPLPRGEIVDPVVCLAKPDQSYALYLPSTYTPDRRWPLLYAFDARRHGKLVAELYRAAAERLGWIVVSSNNARSDEEMDPNVEAMQAMWDDSHARFAIDPRRVYATGHSGGARAACVLATVRAGQVAGVIGHGGGFPFNWPPNRATAFAFFGLAGTRDFNYPELLALDRTLGELGLEHHFETFDGPHDWSPPDEAALALEWMELLAMRTGAAERRAPLVETLWKRFADRAAAALDIDPVAALRRYDALLHDFAGLRSEADLAAARATTERLRAAPGTLTAMAQQSEIDAAQRDYLGRAQGRLRGLLSGTDGFDPVKAARELEVPRLQKEAAKADSAYARLAAERSLATLYGQTIFYLPREFAGRKDFTRALFLVGIATEIRPESVGSWYALAAMRAKSGDARGAMAALKRAREKGRLEGSWLERDGDLDSLRARSDFKALLGELQSQTP